MRKISTLLAVVLLSGSAMAQQVNKNPDATRLVNSNDWKKQASYSESADAARSNPTTGQTGTPGTTNGTEAISAIKVGESSNAFSFIADRDNQISVEPAVGTNGGTIAFIYRQNITNCGGGGSDNGKYRFSISTDGGLNWKIGNGVNVNASTPAPIGQCFGLGTLNPLYTLQSRYPNMTIFADPTKASPNLDDLNAIYVGPVLDAAGADWSGHVIGAATSIAGSPVTTQEAYAYQGGDQYLPSTLVHRPGTNEFFYLAQEGLINDDVHEEINVNRGLWDPATKQITWTTTRIVPPHYKTTLFNNGTEGFMSTPKIAFSPNGQYGWIMHTGDIIGGQDTSANPIFYEWQGNNNWSAPTEVDLRQFPALLDSLGQFLFLNANGDTIQGGVRTTVLRGDLAVDNNGNPHGFYMVANNGTRIINGGTIEPSSGPQFFNPGIVMYLYDITKDSYGDWNAMHVANQSTFDAWFGDLGNSDASARITSGPSLEVSVSSDGNVVMYSWTDSDTTLSTYQTLPGPAEDPGAMTNVNPDLYGRALDLVNNTITPIVNHTLGDPNFGSRAILPKPSIIGINNGSVYTQPMMMLDLPPGQSTLNPVSYIYVPNISYDRSTAFTQTPTFFYNCKQNPFTNTVAVNNAACGTSNGSATVSVAGGLGSKTYLWDVAAGGVTTSVASGLAAGIYSVTVSDSVGCSDVLTVIVNNQNGAVAAIIADSVSNISCAGSTNGTAGLSLTGGTGPFTYAWSNGETTARATSLPAGVSTVTVTDANGCKSFAQVAISEPAAILAEATNKKVKCNGEANGEAKVSASGGTGALTYSWSNGATTSTITGLTAGSYTVTVTDAAGCTNVVTTSVSQPPALTLGLSGVANVVPYTASGTGSGTVVANVQRGGEFGVYTYYWEGPGGYTNGPSTNASFLFAIWGGKYVVAITDENGCSITDSTTIGGPGPPSVGIDRLLNAGLTEMTIQPNPNSGIFNLSVKLNELDALNLEVLNVNGQTIERRSTGRVTETEVAFDLSKLPAGLYLLRVTTSRGSATQRLIIQ